MVRARLRGLGFFFTDAYLTHYSAVKKMHKAFCGAITEKKKVFFFSFSLNCHILKSFSFSSFFFKSDS